MSYFVTRGTGFIGRRMVRQPLQRDGDIHGLILAKELGRRDTLCECWGAASAEPIALAQFTRGIHG